MARWKETFYTTTDLIAHKTRHWATAVLDTALPRHSIIDGMPLHRADNVDADTMANSVEMQAWSQLVFLDEPLCALCGFPFEYTPLFISSTNEGEAVSGQPAANDGMQCAACIARPPKYDQGRAAMVYDDISRKMMLDFKHGGRTDGLDFFTAQLIRSGRDLLSESDLILPVPLHAARLRSRRFNQAALLARGVSKKTKIPYDANCLLRHKNTISQGAQTFDGRRSNVRQAFHVPPKMRHKIQGQTCIIIDDVWTSGATLSACAQTLKQAGAERVNILALMRVVRPTRLPT